MSVTLPIILVVAGLLAGAAVGIPAGWLTRPHWAEQRQGLVGAVVVVCIALVGVGGFFSVQIIDERISNNPVRVSLTTDAHDSDRDYYTTESRPSVAAINSMIGNEEIGDERNFVRLAKGHEPADKDFTENLKLTGDGDVTIRMYVYNDAIEGSGATATGVRARFAVSTYYSTESVSGANVFWDGGEVGTSVKLSSDDDSKVMLIPDLNSIRFVNETLGERGLLLDSKLFKLSGAPIGCTSEDGEIPASSKCNGYIEFQAHIETEPIVPKTNSYWTTMMFLPGEYGEDPEWSTSIEVEPGSRFWVSVRLSNLGTNALRDVSVSTEFFPADLDSELVWVRNPMLADPVEHPAQGVVTGGLVLTYVSSGNTAEITFAVRVPEASFFEKCGRNSFTFRVGATPQGGTPYLHARTIVVQVPCA